MILETQIFFYNLLIIKYKLYIILRLIFKNKLINLPLITTKNIITQSPNEIQAITGATISSKAVVNIINNSILTAKYIYKNRIKNKIEK